MSLDVMKPRTSNWLKLAVRGDTVQDIRYGKFYVVLHPWHHGVIVLREARYDGSAWRWTGDEGGSDWTCGADGTGSEGEPMLMPCVGSVFTGTNIIDGGFLP